MAHKTLINGTAYEIGGGKTLVNGTAYSIDKGKTLVGGTAYEVGFGGKPCTVTIKSQMGGLATFLEKIYVIIDGQIYKATQASGTTTPAIDVATLVVPSGTVMHCCLNGSGAMGGGATVTVNGVTVAGTTSAPSLVEYDYTVNGNIDVLLGGTSTNPQMFIGSIIITEQ